MDTIFALATALGKAGIAVVRISGPEAHLVGEQLAGALPPLGAARVRVLKDKSGSVIDEALVIAFGEKASFTGEQVVEFQCHGAPAVVQRLMSVLSSETAARMAEPGEFTRRALENGQLDLAQIEGLSDLLEAETEAQRIQAMRVFSGELSERTEVWRRDLIRAAALLEATIDFADEEVPEDVSAEVGDLLDRTKAAISQEVSGAASAERVRTGFEVAILGPPNAGKSSLLNRIADREAAIISDIPGTTRDVIEVRVDLNGVPVTFLDTAGLRETDDRVEALGIEKARERAKNADLRVFLGDVSGLDDDLVSQQDLVVRSKSDLDDVAAHMAISSKTGAGISELLDEISNRFVSKASDAGLVIRHRQATALRECLTFLDVAKHHVAMGDAVSEIAAEDIRAGVRSLDALIGRVDVEHILDEIFLSFCLGK